MSDTCRDVQVTAEQKVQFILKAVAEGGKREQHLMLDLLGPPLPAATYVFVVQDRACVALSRLNSRKDTH